LAVALGFIAAGAIVLETILGLKELSPRDWPVEAAILAAIACLAVARLLARLSFVDTDLRAGADRIVSAVDRGAGWVLRGRAIVGIFAVALVGMVAAWAPHYLTWPLWTDHDHVLAMARGWELGKPPWRELVTYQFPGEIELAWLVGRASGWTRPGAYFAADLLISFVLVFAVLRWSVRALGSWLAGLVAAVALIGFFASLPYSLAAQRDSHAMELVLLAWLLLETPPRRRLTSALSAVLYAAALLIRPHAILFAPILMGSLWTHRAPARSLRSTLGAWGAIVLLGLAVGFAPVVLGGLGADFVRSLRFPSSTPGLYAEWSLTHVRTVLGRLGRDGTLWLSLLASGLQASTANGPSHRRLGRIALGFLIAACAFRLVHPVDHHYLRFPLRIVQAWALGPLTAWLVADRRVARSFALGFLGLAVYESVPFRWTTLNPAASVQAVGSLFGGRPPALAPPGAEPAFPPTTQRLYHYAWVDYQQVLAHIRTTTTSSTPVANLLSFYPYPSINGATGRPPAAPLESLVLLSWFPEFDFDVAMSRALADAPPGSLVVYDGPRIDRNLAPRLRRSLTSIGTHYEFEAIYGEMEIWRKRTIAPTAPERSRPMDAK
jgi:hypothetical protein